jgi:hypothetical protein
LSHDAAAVEFEGEFADGGFLGSLFFDLGGVAERGCGLGLQRFQGSLCVALVDGDVDLPGAGEIAGGGAEAELGGFAAIREQFAGADEAGSAADEADVGLRIPGDEVVLFRVLGELALALANRAGDGALMSGFHCVTPFIWW